MDELAYSARNYIVCFKPFAPKYASQVACSEICRKIRKFKLKKMNAIRNRDLPWEELEWKNCRLEEVIAANRKPAKECPQVEASTPQAKRDERKIPQKKYRHICGNCGSVFKSERENDKYCCDQCARESAPCGVM